MKAHSDAPMESVGFGACQAIFDDFRLIQGGESGVWLGQMSISPTQKQVKRAKIEPKHLNPTDSYESRSSGPPRPRTSVRIGP